MPTGPSSTQTQNITAGMVGAPVASNMAGGLLIAQTAIPVGIACTGSIGANGALTLGTALPTATPYTQGVYFFFPAGAVFASSIAGFYLTKMSSTTLGTVFNNIYVAANGLPSIPSALVPVVDAGPGAYTGVTTVQTALQFTVPANVLGPNGALQLEQFAVTNNTAGTKTFATTWGATSVLSYAPTTSQGVYLTRTAMNRGVTNLQTVPFNGLFNLGNSVNAAGTNLSVDTTSVSTITSNLTLATATDFMISEFLRVVAFYGA